MSNVGVRKPSWVLLNIRALLGVLVGCLSSFAGAAPVTEPPFATGVLGSLAPADFYAVDVATDPAGNVYAIDPFYSSISRYGADGVLQLRIDDPAFRWLRGLTVDSQGRMYVLDPTQGFIRIYSAAGSLLDVWYGFIGGESMGVDQNDNIYVALGGAREGTPEVVVYDTAGTELLRFGSLGGGLGQLNRPIDVAVAPDGSMYVVEEANQRVQKFDASGNPLFTIGTTGQAGSAPGEFRAPVSVAVDSKGDWYVSDRRNYRVQKFDSAGNFLLEWGAKGNGPGLFNEQNGITVAPDDTVWVAGYHGHDIQHFDGQGNFLEQWQGNVSGPGEFSQARGIALVGNTLFAVDGWNQRVQAFDVATGQYTFEFGERGQGDATVFNFPRAMTAGPGGDLYISDDDNVRRIRTDGTFVMRYPRPSGPRPGALGLEASADGFLYMTSQGNNEVVKYDAASGVIISRWGSQGSGPGQFKTPRGVVVDSTGTVYVADTGNGRVQLFTTDGQYLAEWGKGATDPIKLSGAGALAIDEVRGLLYVADIWANRVVAYNLQGEVQFYWGTEGVGEGQFRNIYGIEVDGEGTVYVSERDNGRIQKFSYPVSFPNDPPVVQDDVASVIEGSAVNINVAANDSDADDGLDLAGIAIVSEPVNGAVTVRTDGTIDYTATVAGAESDSFTYTIKDAGGAVSNVATVNIDVLMPTEDGTVATLDAVVPVATSAKGGGGGCSLNTSGGDDPAFPLMVLVSTIYLIRRRVWCKILIRVY